MDYKTNRLCIKQTISVISYLRTEKTRKMLYNHSTQYNKLESNESVSQCAEFSKDNFQKYSEILKFPFINNLNDDRATGCFEYKAGAQKSYFNFPADLCCKCGNRRQIENAEVQGICYISCCFSISFTHMLFISLKDKKHGIKLPNTAFVR